MTPRESVQEWSGFYSTPGYSSVSTSLISWTGEALVGDLAVDELSKTLGLNDFAFLEKQSIRGSNVSSGVVTLVFMSNPVDREAAQADRTRQ